MPDQRRRCPVCWQPVQPTVYRRLIENHWDGVGNVCEAGRDGLPFATTLPLTRPNGAVA